MTKETKDLGAAPPHSPTMPVRVTLLWAARAALDDINGLLGGEGDPEGEEVAGIAAAVRDELDVVLRPLVTGTAPQAPPDSSAALLEARRLLVEALEWVDGSWDMPDRRLALLKCIRAFLRSDSERSDQHGKG